MFQLKNVSKIYSNGAGIKNISFSIEDCGVYGVLGANGAGKSTLFNVSTGYLAPSDGEIIINGHDIIKEAELAKKEIGYLPEIPPVYDYMTVKEYLNFAFGLKNTDVKDKASHIEEIMEKTKLTDVKDRLIQNLSKGYKQRVGLAQAIMGYTSIIILDEPSVGLDPAQIIEIRQLIKELGKEHIVIFSSHILTEISEVCDHVIIISKGEMIMSGTMDELDKQMNKETTVSITCRIDEDHLKDVLNRFTAGLTFLVSVETETVDEQFAAAHLSYSSDEELREELYFTLAQKKIPLYEMKAEIRSLEEVFLELTGSDKEEEHVSDI